jgi:L-ascorbate metabolism protein UlaG (beta-lactamase superfamily)
VGHATTVIELGGARLITDPLLRNRLLGVLRRHHGLERAGIGEIHAVLISHLHHDHLDLRSLRAVGSQVPIITPRGGAAFLRKRGFHDVRELRPGEEADVAGIPLRGIEARHAGGRMFGFGDSDCIGYLIEGAARVYFAGDTELCDAMSNLGPRLDVALLPIWGWGPKLGPGHLNPETAAEALALIQPRIAVPIHWGSLAPVGARRIWPWLFEAPARQFVEHAARLAPGVRVSVLAPGERLDLDEAGP